MDVHPSGPFGSAVIYAENPYTIANFGDPYLSERVDRVSLLKEFPRRIDRALERAARILSKAGKTERKIVILLITERHSAGGKHFIEAVKPLRRIGSQTFVILFGNESNVDAFSSLVDTPRDIFRVGTVNNLPQHVRTISKKIREKPGL